MCKKNWSLVFMLSVHVPEFSKGKSLSLFPLQWIRLVFGKKCHATCKHAPSFSSWVWVFILHWYITTSGHQIIKGIKWCYCKMNWFFNTCIHLVIYRIFLLHYSQETWTDISSFKDSKLYVGLALLSYT